MFLVKKIKLMHVHVIDNYFLSHENIIHKIFLIEVVINDYNNLVIFNLIKSSSNPIFYIYCS